MMQLGADDYVSKPIDFDRLAFIIEARIVGAARTKRLPKLVKLKDRVIEILTWGASGDVGRHRSQASLIQTSNRFHLDNARIKLQAGTRTEAAIKAVASGLIKP